jgi:hypothetical protein
MTDIVLFVDLFMDFLAEPRENHFLPDSAIQEPDKNYILD